MTRVLVCGGRTYGCLPRQYDPAEEEALKARAQAERGFLFATLTKLHREIGFTTLIHGGARGADHWAKLWAQQKKVTAVEFKANWYPHGRNGELDRGAGPKRNARMISEGKPDLVIAFFGGRGTRDMTDKARAAGIEVREFRMAEAPAEAA